MTMSLNEKRMLDREALRTVIQQWNANRLDLFELSEPNENLEFHGVMRFYFQDVGQKVATKCIRVQSDATVADVIETLIEKFRPDMRMLSVPNYALYEVHANGEERKLNPDEKPLLVQLNWHVDDREGRFLLKDLDQKPTTLDNTDTNFKRKLSKREKKEQKKKEKLQKLNSNADESENHVAEKLYTELPETSFTRSISNPEAVMRRRRQQKLEKKLQQFRSRDGQPDTGGTLKIYGESLCREVPYKTLLLSIRDCAQAVVREMLSKYGMEKSDDRHFCLVQVNSDGSEYILDDDECPLSILMNHPTSRGSIMFHVRRRPADSQPRRRKKKPLGISNGSGNMTTEREGPMLVEITHSGGDGGRRVKLTSEPIEVGSANTNALQLFGPSIQPRHCLISLHEGVCTVTPLHADGLTFVNGHHITQPTILHNGSVVMFGRTASYRFIDVPSDGRYNLALSQSQLDSAYLYENRSANNPPSWHEDEDASITSSSYTNKKQQAFPQKPMQMTQQQQQAITQSQQHSPGSNELKLTAQQSSDDKSMFDNDAGNIENETKSVSSMRSQDSRSQSFAKQAAAGMSATPTMMEQQGQEAILPAVLEFPEHSQEQFLKAVITDLDVNAPNFKLAPVYTLYLCARYRASTHYRPDLQPTERAHKLTVFLHHVANLIHNIIQEKYNDPKILSFWMANSSEFLHFLKSDRHISAFSVQAQEVLAECVQAAFQNLVSIFHSELSQTLNQFLSENIDHDSAAGLVLSVLGSAMALLRRCRVNAALTIQLFSQLFHYINVVCFNKFVTTSHMCTSSWGKALSDRLALLELWAEKQGLELAADCHLAKINQCAEFLQAPKTSVTEVQQLACSCFRLNSLQMAALLSQETIPRSLIDATVRMAESVADELTRADGREIRLEESPDLPLALLLPVDGFSCDVVRGIPAGLVDFLTPFQSAGCCRLASQPTSIGLWTVYMHQFNGRSPSVMSTKMPQPEVQTIKLHKNSNGMGLSIVAAKGAGQERLGIYIKSVVAGGAADSDGRLQAGDQLLRVDGQSLIGITQERAADYLVRTGPIVTLEVAKQGAIFHGLATLLQQPSPVIQRDDDMYNSDSDENIRRYRLGHKPLSSSYQQQHLIPRPSSTLSLNQIHLRRMSNPDIYPGRRRYSTSFSDDDILSNDQLDQIHFDPRYRDYRSASSLNNSNYRSRSNSLHSMASTGNVHIQQYQPYRRVSSQSPPLLVPLIPQKRWDTNPSIFIEEYRDEDEAEAPKSESLKSENSNAKRDSKETICTSNDSLQPALSVYDIKSFGDLSEIPFIDDDSNETAPCRVLSETELSQKNSTAITSSIVKNTGGSNTCRKTVSFDMLKSGPSQQRLYSTAGNGGRRMSERDMTKVGAESKPPIAGAQMLNSKSVPALHHIGNAGNKSKSTQNLTAQSSSSAGNISATDQGFYQNLSVYRQQNQSHPNLGDNRSMNHQLNPPVAQIGNSSNTPINAMNQRPASAYFNTSNNSNVMNLSSTPNIPNTSQSTSTGNLMQVNPSSSAMMGFNSNHGNANMMPSPAQQQQQHISHPNLSGMSNASSSITNSPITAHRPPMMPNKQPQQQPGNFMRDPRMNPQQQQMMAPSMPNIAHASGFATNIPASQSMQSVNQIPGNYYMQQQHQQQFQESQMQQYAQQNPQLSPNHQASLMRGTAKMAEMGELLKRQQRNQQPATTNGPIHFTNSMDNIHIPQTNLPPQMLSPNSQNRQVFHPQSPQKQLAPSTAPKPQRMEEQPPLPPSSTHPLFKNAPAQQSSQQVAPILNYSSTDAPKTALYPTQQNAQTKTNVSAASNPWEREEREKELEIRREQIRHWRDQQIVELSLLPSRTPQQEEQLKTLVLERDFERRAQEEENEEENDMQYQKNLEVLRLQSNSVPSQITVPTTRLKQVDIKTTPTNISPTSDISPTTQAENVAQSSQMSHPPLVQPKGILKSTNAYNSSNPSSPSKHGKVTSFASQVDTKTQNLTEITMNNTNANQMLTQISKEMAEMTIEYQTDDQNSMPPPPPERGSSFAVMQHQKLRNSGTFQKLSFNEHPIINNTNSKYITSNEHSPMLSPTTAIGPGTFTAHQIQQQLNIINNNNNNNNVSAFTRDNKRVSFHDHENNNVVDISSTTEHDLSAIREDPNRFIDDATAMLQSPQTPETPDTNWGGIIQSTPGVIGAQEVYRDPRQRRLAEQQQQKKTETPVPEKLSFKEKMKMFALESGENNTPKDKLKISRAQRDIDAVH